MSEQEQPPNQPTQGPDASTTGSYPEGQELKSFVKARNRGGFLWQLSFQVAIIAAILALTALLYNIINGAFGYVAIQNEINPEEVVVIARSNQMLEAPNTFSSEDDNELVEGIAGNVNAIGFFGYAYYQQNRDVLNVLTINDVPPTAETAESGEYPLTRPLFIYTDPDLLADPDRPEIAAFVNYYLNNVTSVITEVGYFPATPETINAGLRQLANAMGTNEPSFADLASFETQESGRIYIAGSSTVEPLSREMLRGIRQAGYRGDLSIAGEGTSSGFAAFCAGEADIADASRPVRRSEVEECAANGRELIEFRVGTDALAVTDAAENDFVANITTDALIQIFTGAENWSDVRPGAWPDAPIERFIPGADSGTLAFFAETLFPAPLEEMPRETLLEVLEANISAGRYRALAAELDFANRDREAIYELVVAEVVNPRVVQSWNLVDSLTNRVEIEQAVENIPNGKLEWRSWVSPEFITSPQSSLPEFAGIRTAILGSLWIIAIVILVAFPLGVGAAVYLEEYAANVSNPILRWINNAIQTNINNLAGVPSIIYGMLGLAIFVRLMEPITSGAVFGFGGADTGANGRTIISAGLTLALLVLPLIIINSQEAIRAVPNSLRMAGQGLGATKWQTIWSHVLPNAIPGILTGTILAMSRAIGETAPLVVVGASTFITVDPTGPFSKFTALPIQIYQWTSRPQDEFRNIAAAGIVILLILLLSLNASAVLLRNRFSRRLSS